MILKIIHFNNSEKNKIRLDKYLTDQLGWTKTKVQNWIKNNQIIVNDKIISKPGFILDQLEYRIQINQSETIPIIETNQREISNQPIFSQIKIVYEDDAIIIIDKPSGLLSHPTSKNENDTLTDFLAFYFSQNPQAVDLLRNGLVHRLDKETSGLMIVAKTETALKQILLDFEKKVVIKKYCAIVQGKLPHKHLKINLPIGRSNDGTLKMRVNAQKDLKDAITEVNELEQLHNHTLVECNLLTGRTHQIRVHLAHINNPVLNDYLYGHKIPGDLFGQYLHASYLEFDHPVTKKRISFKSQWPQEFDTKYHQLRFKDLKNE
ncbi:23S rRNA pseudouridine1911/1915/1917 synthase [Mycoplasmoides fastidiosum]|uniref:Pseudouridine synthase n=1 Tax=Mycoplasmoides fastidiosum TaxID=92758 RepID=A0ABU0LYS9_9BACT|nr:RluA family pseudouridine synthase [Mycoplasmoides fastidiosum]MDQ0513827.1 23S rRNA pseudouridine1911/1915/1917 synthase [Mycoplasmoides fastidiosum]UUD37756.1 RluA family pseudouridine synthase [Mycoplasmoides fastidiosum]